MKVTKRIFCLCTEFSFISCYLRCWAGGSALSLCWRCESQLRELKVSLGWALNLFSVSWGTDVLRPNVTAAVVEQEEE